MAKKIKDRNMAAALARARELYKCEGEILHIFDIYHVTTPEAVFMFERIKFNALYSDATKTQKQHPKPPVITGNMFR